MYAWCQYLYSELKNYFTDACLIDLVTFVTYQNLLWNWIHVWPLLGIPFDETADKEAVDLKGLHLMGLKQQFDPYRHLLSQFLTDTTRAGIFFITSKHYTRVALRIVKYLFEPKKP
jgi:hypothetical protein